MVHEKVHEKVHGEAAPDQPMRINTCLKAQGSCTRPQADSKREAADNWWSEEITGDVRMRSGTSHCGVIQKTGLICRRRG